MHLVGCTVGILPVAYTFLSMKFVVNDLEDVQACSAVCNINTWNRLNPILIDLLPTFLVLIEVFILLASKY